MKSPKAWWYIVLIGIYISIIACGNFQNDKDVTYFQYLANGRSLYKNHCENCHGSKGEGFQQLYPPLNDTLFLRKNKKNLACIIKYGISNDSLQISNKTYHETMPGNNQLKAIDIAQIIVYITNNFGNNQGFYNYQQVQSDLKDCTNP